MGNCWSDHVEDSGSRLAAKEAALQSLPSRREPGVSCAAGSCGAQSGTSSPPSSSGNDCAVILQCSELGMLPAKQQQPQKEQQGAVSALEGQDVMGIRRPRQQQSQQLWYALDQAANQLVRSVSDSYATMVSGPSATSGGVCTVLPAGEVADGPARAAHTAPAILRLASADATCCLEAFAAYVPVHGASLASRAAVLCLHLFQVAAVAVVQEVPAPQSHAPACSVVAHAGTALSHAELTAAGGAALRALSAHHHAALACGDQHGQPQLLMAQPLHDSAGVPSLDLAVAVPLSSCHGHGAARGALCLLDPRPGRGPLSASESELLCCIADLVARDMGSSHLEPVISGSLFEATATVPDPSAAAGWVAVPVPHSAAGSASTGLALVDTLSLGLPVLLENSMWGKFLTVAPRCGGAAPPPAAARGLSALLSLGAEEAGAAAAAARAGRGFVLSSCVTHQLGGSMHLKVTCTPAAAALGDTPKACSSTKAQSSCGGGSGSGGCTSTDRPPCASLGSVYIAAVDFLDGRDVDMWLPTGGARRFMLLPSAAAPSA